MALKEAYEDIRTRGAELVTLSPQLPHITREWIEEAGLEHPVLVDLGNVVAAEYGLRFTVPDDLREVYLDSLGIDLPRDNGDPTWTLPFPASFVVGVEGTIRHAAADPDYTFRPEPSELVDVLDRLDS